MKIKNRKPHRGKKRLHLWLIIVAVLLVSSAVLLKLRWHAWFGNVEESAYTTTNTIDRLTITPGEQFASSRTISWRCGEAVQEAYLLYAKRSGTTAPDSLHWERTEAQGEVIATRGGRGCYYTARLDSLEVGVDYLYRACVGRQVAEGSFSISSELDSVTRFVYLGDVQDPSGELSGTQLKYLTQEVDSAFRPDFIATAGDQIEGSTDAYWQVWYRSWGEAYTARMPFVVATGNHEYLKKGLGRALDERWVPQYNYPDNGPEGFERRSYYIDMPLMRLIVLDSNGIGGPIDIARHRSWLKEVLGTSPQPWQVVMFHHAVRCVRESRNHPVMRYIFQPILEDYGADLVLQGHDHAYSRITTKHEGDTISPVYLISSSSPKVYRNGFDPIHDRLGSGLQLYQTIEVRPTSLHYQSRLYTGELYDDLEIWHNGGSGAHKVVDNARGIAERFEFAAFATSPKGEKKARHYLEEVRSRAAKRLER